jgi:hypothetical protein
LALLSMVKVKDEPAVDGCMIWKPLSARIVV